MSVEELDYLQSPVYCSSDSGRLFYFTRVIFFPHHGFFDIPGMIFTKLPQNAVCY